MKIINFFGNYFRRFSIAYLLKAYLVAVVFAFFTIAVMNSVLSPVYVVVCALIYPFACMLIDRIIPPLAHPLDLFTAYYGESVLGGLLLYFVKLILLYMAFVFAVLVAPVGLLSMVIYDAYQSLNERWRG